MPELPEVETVVRGLAPIVTGLMVAAVDVRSPKIRNLVPRALVCGLVGGTVIGVTRRAKYILVTFDTHDVLVVHLGMSGALLALSANCDFRKLDRHDHLLVTFSNGVRLLFRDPRRFGVLDVLRDGVVSTSPMFAHLGPEPLERSFTARCLLDRLAGRQAPIKVVLLDQRVVAGIGNIYASEALFYAGISPDLPAGALDLLQCRALVAAIKRVLRKAIASGGSTLKDYRDARGEIGGFQNKFAVYDREGLACSGCTCRLGATGGVQKMVQGGRSTFYCPTKQRWPEKG